MAAKKNVSVSSSGSNKRKNPTDNVDAILYAQVDGICPKCFKVLMYEANGRNYKDFEVAHIYPLNPTPAEKALLEGQDLLNNDVNHIDNFIALCGGCHGKFDKPRTVDGYREMVAIKQKLINEDKSREQWAKFSLEAEISQLINGLLEETNDGLAFDPSFNPKKIESKANGTLSNPTKHQIKFNVASYYNTVKEKFKQIDSLYPGTSELISGQVNLFYKKSKQIDKSQEYIFNSLVDWMYSRTGQKSKSASFIIISFFVQNCEVFE